MNIPINVPIIVPIIEIYSVIQAPVKNICQFLLNDFYNPINTHLFSYFSVFNVYVYATRGGGVLCFVFLYSAIALAQW